MIIKIKIEFFFEWSPGGEHPHLNCIQKCGRPQIEGLIFEENEIKPYNTRLILENRAKTLNLAKLGLHTLAQG